MSTIFLTGASGLVGSELLRRYAAASQRTRLVALAHRAHIAEPAEAVAGDVCHSALGLATSTAAELRREVDTIVHCAADTRFNRPLEAVREVNTRGTEHVLEFARSCPRLRKFIFISTVYVAGNRTGSIAETFGPRPTRFFNTYQQSKYEAEELVNDAARELPAMVLRLSSIAGDEATGAVPRFTYVHQLIRLLPRSPLPVAPGDLDAPIDLLSTDYAVAAIKHIIDCSFEPGITVQVCSGARSSLPMREMLRMTLDTIGRPVTLPEFVGLETYETWAHKETENGSRLTRQVIEAVGHFLPHLALRQEFQNCRAERALAGSGICLAPVANWFPNVVRYCLANSRS